MQYFQIIKYENSGPCLRVSVYYARTGSAEQNAVRLVLNRKHYVLYRYVYRYSRKIRVVCVSVYTYRCRLSLTYMRNVVERYSPAE